ncbi:MAG: hypothetical protein U5K79_10145 [Cyclobacteriaceae bacterium]|nr:hypothetical protein [Cyclobacteriaceae bacterium]
MLKVRKMVIGYSFWIDELNFEKLGTIAQPRPAIFSGQDESVDTFIGTAIHYSRTNPDIQFGIGN